MKAVILAGGYGTRISAITKGRSKVLMPVAGRPVVEYVVDTVNTVDDVDEIVLVTNDRYYQDFCEWSDGYDHEGRLTVINDHTNSNQDRLGAVGDVIFAVETGQINDDLLVVAGDNICDFDLKAMRMKAKTSGSTIALYDVGSVEEAKKFSNVEMDKEGRIVKFVEKPEAPEDSLVAVALYMICQQELALLDAYKREGNSLDLLGGFIEWACGRASIYGYRCGGTWWDIGDPAIYAEANEHYSKGPER